MEDIIIRKRFTKEFRDEAVQLTINGDIPQRQLAEDLGVGKSTLFKWMTDYRQKQGSMNSDVTPVNELKLELRRLRKENRILREERDILKKATAFFASQK